jgi:hypothetical protein
VSNEEDQKYELSYKESTSSEEDAEIDMVKASGCHFENGLLVSDANNNEVVIEN